ncbi:hypothetical protein KP509_34G058500 [Ceratopteris richardii]|uniref:Wall-associated receptor kinase galacturonan-binding domain-containing protein n=1 Tax=Ceratopteris richardii TaxID=49495 RepID=A0A8T2QMK0_CERRI|nr:hypothetical protein KP509_34G058500 [Ceratopteris richardii]
MNSIRRRFPEVPVSRSYKGQAPDTRLRVSLQMGIMLSPLHRISVRFLQMMVVAELMNMSKVLLSMASADSTCQNVCGDVPVMYPFGTGSGCGNKVFEKYVSCNNGKLLLHTPTGQYQVQRIDYTNNLLILQDPKMSTCENMQGSSNFGLPVDAPFSIVGDTFVLLNCLSTSMLYNGLSSLCDPAGTNICQSLYSCSSVSQLGLEVNAPTSSCCVYTNPQLSSPPYELNLQLLQCSSYTSIYSFGPEYGSGGDGSDPAAANAYPNPSSWSYGIALKFYYDETAYYSSCKACEQSNGVCAYNVYGFVCVCSAGVNTTTRCLGDGMNNAVGEESFRNRALELTGLIALLLDIFYSFL